MAGAWNQTPLQFCALRSFARHLPLCALFIWLLAFLIHLWPLYIRLCTPFIQSRALFMGSFFIYFILFMVYLSLDINRKSKYLQEELKGKPNFVKSNHQIKPDQIQDKKKMNKNKLYWASILQKSTIST